MQKIQKDISVSIDIDMTPFLPIILVLSPKAARVIDFLDILSGIVYAYSSKFLYSLVASSIKSN